MRKRIIKLLFSGGGDHINIFFLAPRYHRLIFASHRAPLLFTLESALPSATALPSQSRSKNKNTKQKNKRPKKHTHSSRIGSESIHFLFVVHEG